MVFSDEQHRAYRMRDILSFRHRREAAKTDKVIKAMKPV